MLKKTLWAILCLKLTLLIGVCLFFAIQDAAAIPLFEPIDSLDRVQWLRLVLAGVEMGIASASAKFLKFIIKNKDA